MNKISKEILQELRSTYQSGCRVELLKLEDPYREIPLHTQGTVQSVDDLGTIHVSWDGYSTLGIVYGVDSCKKLET